MRPRRVKVGRAEWFQTRRKELMQAYIKDRSGLLWEAWLNQVYGAYRG